MYKSHNVRQPLSKTNVGLQAKPIPGLRWFSLGNSYCFAGVLLLALDAP